MPDRVLLIHLVRVWQGLCKEIVQINLLKSFVTQQERIVPTKLILNLWFNLILGYRMNVMCGYPYCSVLKMT